MGDHYMSESQSASDQEELVGGTDIEDDALSDGEEMQFTYCKTITDENDVPLPANYCSSFTSDMNHDSKSILLLFLKIAMLALSSFVLLISFPLYFQQLTAAGVKHNAYGAMLYVSLVITAVILLAALSASWFFKWDMKPHRSPLPWKRLALVSAVSGMASTICLICSYQRVSCHLQDPLKGFVLAFSIMFYFFFCKKMMGLQKIFSATTAVVGLFISVDYGLCDEFRCRGINISSSNKTTTVGWQGKAVWTIFYIGGLALWTLQLSLLEGDVVTSKSNLKAVPTSNLLTTVSRLVSNAAEIPNRTDVPKIDKKKPRALHVTLWVHSFSLIVVILLGWIDLLPGTGPISSPIEFWRNTKGTFLCHLNAPYNAVPATISHQATFEFLSNLTPGSVLYNQTVQKLRRTKRHISNRLFFHKRINNYNSLHSLHATNETDNSEHPHFNANFTHFHHRNRLQHTAESVKIRDKYKPTAKYGNNTVNSHNQTPIKVSHLILNPSNFSQDKCAPLLKYSLLFSGSYVVFIVCAIHFLFLTESAVFTVAVLSSSLPVGGIFWSIFELTTEENLGIINVLITFANILAKIIWAPEVTGELICSLLGTPIVILGIVLFASAHIKDTVRSQAYSPLSSSDT